MDQNNDKKIKAWITWPDGAKYGWFHCQLILENGWPIYGHLCSEPGFAHSDLWGRRQERQNEWAKHGLELEIVDQVPHSKLPAHVLENNKNEAYVEWAQKYFGPLEPEGPVATVVMTDDKGDEYEVSTYADGRKTQKKIEKQQEATP